MTNDTFLFLIRHEMRMEGGRFLKRQWMWIYAAILLVALFAVFTIWGGRMDDQINPLIYLSYMFPFAAFIATLRSIKREWRNETVGWWITLPYSRGWLLAAKYIGAILKIILVYVGFSALLLLLSLYSAAVHGDGFEPVSVLLSGFGYIYTILLMVTPLMLSLGMLTAAIRRSRLRAFAPIAWIAFGTLGNALSWTSSSTTIPADRFSLGNLPLWMLWATPVAWVLAAVLFRATAAVMKNLLDL